MLSENFSAPRSYLYGAAARGADEGAATPLAGYGVGCWAAKCSKAPCKFEGHCYFLYYFSSLEQFSPYLVTLRCIVLFACVFFNVLLERDGTWDTSDCCQNLLVFFARSICEASRCPDCMLDTWVVSSNSQHIQAGRWPDGHQLATRWP